MTRPVPEDGEVLYFYFFDMKSNRNILSMETKSGAKIELSAPNGDAARDLDSLIENFYGHVVEAMTQLQDYEARWFTDQFTEITAPLDDI